MSLLSAAPGEIRAFVKKHNQFEEIVSRARDYRDTHRKDPAYIGDMGRIILARDVVSIVRDAAIENNFHSTNDNGIVAGALTLLGIPHAEVIPGLFTKETHPGLYAVFQGLRRSVGKKHDNSAIEAFVRSIDRLTPDARDDAERTEITHEILGAANVHGDFSYLLTPTPYLSRLAVPSLVDKGWINSPYASIDFLRPKA